MMNLGEKLCAIQNGLKAPKNQYNPFGKYNYRSCEDILEALKPLLEKYKVALYIFDELEAIGSRYYIKATARLFDLEHIGDNQDGQTCIATAYAREDETRKGMTGDQLTGCASSYARKYALNGLFLIDDTKDSDATNTSTKSAFICSDCGKTIDAVQGVDGAIIAQRTKEKYGKQLCMSCIEKLKESGGH